MHLSRSRTEFEAYTSHAPTRVFRLLVKIALLESKSISAATFPWALCPTHAHKIVTASFQQGVSFAAMDALSMAQDSTMEGNMSSVCEA